MAPPARIKRNSTTLVDDLNRIVYAGAFRLVDVTSAELSDADPVVVGPLSAGRVWVKARGGDAMIHIGKPDGEADPFAEGRAMPMTAGADYYFAVDEGDVVSVLGADEGESSGTIYLATEVPIPGAEDGEGV